MISFGSETYLKPNMDDGLAIVCVCVVCFGQQFDDAN